MKTVSCQLSVVSCLLLATLTVGPAMAAVPPAQFTAALAGAAATIDLDPAQVYPPINIPRPVTIDGHGAVVDGKFLTNRLLSGSAGNVVIKNLILRNARNNLQDDAGVIVSAGWNLTNDQVQNCQGTGILVHGDGAVLDTVSSTANGEQGIKVEGCANVLLHNCSSTGNNKGIVNPLWKSSPNAVQVNGLWYVRTVFEAGGGKMWLTTNLTIDGGDWSNNCGPGIWFDSASTGAVVENLKATGNAGITPADWYTGVGVQIEWSQNPQGTQSGGSYSVHDCDLTGNSGFGLVLDDCRGINPGDIAILHNTIDGLLLRAQGRVVVGNISVLANILSPSKKSGVGTITGWSTPTKLGVAQLLAQGVIIDQNRITWSPSSIDSVQYQTIAAIQELWPAFQASAVPADVGPRVLIASNAAQIAALQAAIVADQANLVADQNQLSKDQAALAAAQGN